MSFEISDDLLSKANMTEQEFKLEIAILLYQKEVFTLGKAAEFVGIPKLIFQKALAKRNIPVSYNYEEFQHDLSMLKEKYGKI